MVRKASEITIELATATTPAYSQQGYQASEKATAEDRAMMHLTPAEFGQQLRVLAKETKFLVTMARKVEKAPGRSLTLKDGTHFGVKELNGLVSRHNKSLKQLKKNYTARGRRRPRGGANKEEKTLTKGAFLRDEMLEFVNNANFGTVNGASGGGAKVQTLLQPLLQYGMLSRTIMTILVTLYEKVNKLRVEVDVNGKVAKFYSAGKDMEKYLGSYLTAIEQADTGLTKEGNPREKFDRRRFNYNRLLSISSAGLVRKEDLDATRQEYIDNEAIQAQVKAIQVQLSAINASWGK